jgi:SPP1 family predicted phage head-tail adaptor
MRHRVTIQQKAPTRDTFGGEVEAWNAVATVWASVEPLQGREFLEARQLQAEVTTRIRIRYRAGIVPQMRVVWGSHFYDVQAVIETEARRRELQLMCIEAV